MIMIVMTKVIDITVTMVVIMATILITPVIDANMMIGIHDGTTEVIATTTITTVVPLHHHIIIINVNQSHHLIKLEMLYLGLSAE